MEWERYHAELRAVCPVGAPESSITSFGALDRPTTSKAETTTAARQRASRSRARTLFSFPLGLSLSLTVVLSLCLVEVVTVSGSTTGGKSYNAYNFDLTTPQFTPDGRLLQVEYASAASEHSSPLVALTLPLPLEEGLKKEENQETGTVLLSKQQEFEQALVLISVKQSSTKSSTMEDESNGSHENTNLDPTRTGSSTFPIMTACHNRLVIIPSSHNDFSNNEIRYNNNRDVVVAMSGVLADCVALLQKVWDQVSKHYQLYQTHLSCVQVAQVLADACQVHSFGGGIRPYGSTMLVCGMNDAERPANVQHTLMQTDPSGGIVVVPSPSLPEDLSKTSEAKASKSSTNPKNIRWFRRHDKGNSGSDSNRVRWILGGTSSQQRQLRSVLEQELGRLVESAASAIPSSDSKAREDAPTVNILVDGIALAVRAMIKEQQGQQALPKSLVGSKQYGIEVVVMSATVGVHRLSDKHLDAVWKRVGELNNK